ncbi:MAG TPA: MbnP family protein [Flavipsychrobacter sp.]
MKNRIFILMMAVLVVSACRKEKENVIPTPTVGDLTINLGYHVDGEQLLFDSLRYTNAAGNMYSVTKVHYYLSRFRFYNRGEVKYSSDTIIYADAAQTTSFTFRSLPATIYDSVSFYIGLDEAQNISNSLPATAENVNMGWPDVMGGGYHFLKLEGHWMDSTGKLGYAMHIGKNGFLVRSGMKKGITIPGGKTSVMKLMMNINRWFANPNTYDLAKDGVYSMGNAPLMKKLSENGEDVFTIE